MLTASEFRASLIAHGYKRGAPFPEARRLDKIIASALMCFRCRRQPFYAGYTKGREYRALIICEKCNTAIELLPNGQED